MILRILVQNSFESNNKLESMFNTFICLYFCELEPTTNDSQIYTDVPSLTIDKFLIFFKELYLAICDQQEADYKEHILKIVEADERYSSEENYNINSTVASSLHSIEKSPTEIDIA